MVKNPNWQEADQLAIYKRGRGVGLGAAYLGKQVFCKQVIVAKYFATL